MTISGCFKTDQHLVNIPHRWGACPNARFLLGEQSLLLLLIRHRAKILAFAGISVSALLGTPVQAEKLPAGHFWLELSGTGPFWHASRGENYFIGATETKPEYGAAFFGEAGYRSSGSPWSITMRGGYGVSARLETAFNTSGTISGISAAFVGTADVKENLSFLDFEAGRDVIFGSSGTKLRLHAGLRYARFRSKETGSGDQTYNGSTWAVTTLVKRKFSGVGPRIGLGSRTPLAESLSLRLDASGALLFGRRKYHATIIYPGFGLFTDDRNRETVVPVLSAHAALAWTPPSVPGMTVSLGYSVEAYFGITETWHVSGYGKSDRIIHGPKLSVRFEF